MNDWPVIFLGVIAVSTLIMALIQVGAIIATLKVARETQKMLAHVQQDVRPLIARANAIADDAAKTAALATAQAQKIDKLVTDLTRRIDDTAAVVQHAIVTPAREGMAVVAAIKAGLGVIRGMGDFRARPGGHPDDEDPLFIG